MVIASLATIIWLLQEIIQIYIYIVIAAVIMSWLLALGTLNIRNNLVRQIVQALDMLTEPVFRRVRRIIPAMGPLDISPMIVIVILWAVGFIFLPILYGRLLMGSLF
jgi:YggT family protein